LAVLGLKKRIATVLPAFQTFIFCSNEQNVLTTSPPSTCLGKIIGFKARGGLR
jgi:hypothetical protein